jgi:ABC-type branched-subunit amino acid transport system substrate-binding protein
MNDRENIRLMISLFIAGILLAIILSVANYFFKPQPSVTDNPDSISNTSPTIISYSQTLNNDLFSYGERNILTDSPRSSDIDNGIEAFRNGKYSESIKFFNNALKDNPNLPDIKIYLNNSKARLAKETFTLAAVVPAVNASDLAREILRGVADVQAEINGQGGLNNRLLQIIIANDADNENQAREVAKKLALSSEILGLIGHNNGKNTLAGLPDYEKFGLAVMTPSSAGSKLKNQEFHVFFRATYSDKILAKKLVNYIKNDLKLNKVAVFVNQKDITSLSFKESLQEKFQGTISPVFDFNNFDANTVNIIIQDLVKQQIKAAVLFPDIGYINKAKLLAKANSALPESSKLQLFGGTIFNRSKTLIEDGEDLKNLIIVVPWFPEVDKSKVFAQEAEARWRNIITFRTAFSFDATKAFIQALSKSSVFNKPNPSRQEILQQLKSTNLSATETSGEPLVFKDGERISGEPILIKVVGDKESKYKFELVK